MKHYFSARLNKFSEQEKDIVQAGVELYNHYRFENAKSENIKSKYREYASGKSLREKEELFSKSLVAVTNKYAGLPSDHQFSEAQLRSNPNVKWATFQLISEMLDIIVPETVLENFYQFADVKTVGWGDNLVFNVPSSDLFVVSTASNAVRNAGKQRLLGTDVVLNPVNHILTIGDDYYRILAGKVNWGDWVTRVAQSVETQITVDVYNAIINSYSNLAANYQGTGAFNSTSFNQLVNRVTAANRGGKASAFGTKIALSKVVPADQYFRFGLGEEYNTFGYLTNYQGTSLFGLDQALVPNTDNFAIDDATVIILSSVAQKIVKIGFEGNTQIVESQVAQNADMSMTHTIQKRWDVKVATSGKYAIWSSIS